MNMELGELCRQCKESIEENSLPQGSPVLFDNGTHANQAKTPWSCLYASCLHKAENNRCLGKKPTFPKREELKEPIHYYIENGLYVFTEQYHLLRGSCCHSGCRHCPYGLKK